VQPRARDKDGDTEVMDGGLSRSLREAPGDTRHSIGINVEAGSGEPIRFSARNPDSCFSGASDVGAFRELSVALPST